ncbi:Rha family transcriptional regulator [Paenisporosarcina cavernae]|uniref:Rha family transcriptional regulator n=1 Tax=Paenisporosarcina cavernae TaxID=2320858 RepID=UPI001EE5777D|nr:Rha family transcriptional regulator [Paenisporosarcina cavernae]
MSQLKVVSIDGQLVTDSRDVAEMVGRSHNELMKSIRTYIEYLGQGEIAHSDFFIESTYQNSQNKTQPCFLIT